MVRNRGEEGEWDCLFQRQCRSYIGLSHLWKCPLLSFPSKQLRHQLSAVWNSTLTANPAWGSAQLICPPVSDAVTGRLERRELAAAASWAASMLLCIQAVPWGIGVLGAQGWDGKCFLGVQNRAAWSWRKLFLRLSTADTRCNSTEHPKGGPRYIAVLSSPCMSAKCSDTGSGGSDKYVYGNETEHA